MRRVAGKCLTIALLLALGTLVPGRVSFAALKHSSHADAFVGTGVPGAALHAGHALGKQDSTTPTVAGPPVVAQTGLPLSQQPLSVWLTLDSTRYSQDSQHRPFAPRPPPVGSLAL